jgi:mannose-6-phosphate isomerase-like protein (cupin superfamily)
MGSFRLGPSQVATAIYHLTVDELWYITSGSGYIWRAPSGHPEQGKVDRLEPGVSIAIPVGTHFQWRADGGAALDVLGVDAPAWPGDGEAVLSNMAPWRATVGDAA